MMRVTLRRRCAAMDHAPSRDAVHDGRTVTCACGRQRWVLLSAEQMQALLAP